MRYGLMCRLGSDYLMPSVLHTPVANCKRSPRKVRVLAPSLGELMKMIWHMLVFSVRLSVHAAALFWWCLYIARAGTGVLRELWSNRTVLAGGPLVCPNGHTIETDNQRVRCSCGWVQDGSLLYCDNPECDAKTASFVNCPTCGLSVRSPGRVGAP